MRRHCESHRFSGSIPRTAPPRATCKVALGVPKNGPELSDSLVHDPLWVSARVAAGPQGGYEPSQGMRQAPVAGFGQSRGSGDGVGGCYRETVPLICDVRPPPERRIRNERIAIWLDAQRQYSAIEQRAVERTARYADAEVAAMAAMGGTDRTLPHPIRRLRAAWTAGAAAAGAAAAGPAAAQGRAGRQPVRPWRTRLRR